MAKQIIILDKVSVSLGHTSYNVAFWVIVPSARQQFYADPNKTSQYLDISPEELASLRDGSILERIETYAVTGTPNLATIKQALQDRFNALQAEVTAYNAWGFYGSSWDGTVWTAGGVA